MATEARRCKRGVSSATPNPGVQGEYVACGAAPAALALSAQQIPVNPTVEALTVGPVP